MNTHESSNSPGDQTDQFLSQMRDAEAKAWWKGKTSAVGETDEQCVVIGPQFDLAPEKLKLLGEKLKHWQETHSYARHIWGLDDLLEGRPPRTPPIYLSVPYSVDRYAECYEQVALAFVAKGTDHKRAAESLAEVLGELCDHLAWFTDPMYYSYMNR